LTSGSRTGYSASYTYDANGNRLTKTLGGTTETYTVDDADKLTSISVGGSTTKSYGYDSAGRTTSVTTGAGMTTLAYDYEGRVTQITYPNSSTNTFTYNGLDTRVGKVDSTGTKTYKRDGAYVTDPVLSDSVASYTPGISERRSSTTKFYHTDRLGTTERLTNTSQTTTDTRSYDAFGLLVSSSGSTPTPFGFAGAWGYQEDADSGLKLLGHRYYDPSTGRFLTRDPVQDGSNWYGYASNNPFSKVDPDGLQARGKGGLHLAYLKHLIQAIKEEAWEGIPELWKAVTGHDLPDWVVDIIKQIAEGKKLGKPKVKPEGLIYRINEHIDKVENNPGSRDVRKWKREIRTWMRDVIGGK
jgi:RHS repeat-associated protein